MLKSRNQSARCHFGQAMTPLSIAGGQIRYAVDARRGPVPHSSLCLLGDLTDTRRRRRRRNCGASCGVAQMRCCKKKVRLSLSGPS